MTRESDDPITAAIIATEKEIAGAAWDNEETDALDPTGDRSLEQQGEGLEGQHEADDETDGEEADSESDAEGEGEDGEVDGEQQPLAAKAETKSEAETKSAATDQRAHVPPVKLREANERARAAEAREAELKANFERSQAESKAQLDLVMKQIAALQMAPRTEAPKPATVVPEVIPDIFEDPKGFAEHLQKGFQKELSNRDLQLANMRVETSMAIAHGLHKETFEKAWTAVNSLNANDPDARATVQRIYASPNPGEALVNWHKRNETFARVGDDPAAFEERIRKETREALAKDPEFVKSVVASMRQEAGVGDDGRPRTTVRLPKSLNGAQGSNVGAGRVDPDASDGSEQSIANAAWR